jgi:small basic protein
MRAFMAAIFIVGVIRFVLTVSGVPDNIVKYFSMSVVMTAGTVYFALKTETHLERLKAAYLLVLPYMIIEVAALGYTWATGNPTIFHAAEYSLGFSLPLHTLGHLIGGLTWEPLFAFAIMEILWVASRAIANFTKT